MANVLVEEQTLIDIADAIREHSGEYDKENKYKPADVPDGIRLVFDEGYYYGENDGWNDGFEDGYDSGYEDGKANGGSDEQWNGFWARTLTSVVIPNGTKVIAEFTFYMWEILESVEFPDTLVTICQSAFDYAGLLGTLTIPASVEYIADDAFCQNYDLVEVIFKGTPRVIGNAFYDCDITTIKVPWSEGEVAGAPWGADYADIIYDWIEEE